MPVLAAQARFRDRWSVPGLQWNQQPPCEAGVFIEPGVPPDLELVPGMQGCGQKARIGLARGLAVNGRYRSGPGLDPGSGIRSGAVDGGAEDGDLTAGDLVSAPAARASCGATS